MLNAKSCDSSFTFPIKGLILALAIVPFVSIGDGYAQVGDSKESSGDARSRIEAVYVYAEQKRAGQDIAKHLKSFRINVRLVGGNDLDSDTFQGADLIIIGSDTFPVWGFAFTDETITGAKLPVLAMGKGGHKLFGNLKLKIGSRGDPDKKFSVRKVKEAVFWDAFRKQPSEGGIFDCYTRSRSISIHFPEADPEVIPIAEDVDRDDYYPLIVQKPYYFFWGFDGTLDQMTSTGRLLLPWACHYTVAMKRFPKRAFTSQSGE